MYKKVHMCFILSTSNVILHLFDTCSQFVCTFIYTTFLISHDMFDRSEALLNPILVTAMVTNINQCICISFLGVWDHDRRAVW